MWQVTRDRWHVTRDTWHMTHSVGWTFSQNFNSLALPVWDWECLEDILSKGSLNQSINQLINDRGDCRTAPATPGLLNISHKTDLAFTQGNWCSLFANKTNKHKHKNKQTLLLTNTPNLVDEVRLKHQFGRAGLKCVGFFWGDLEWSHSS